jgi:hypothetical protein
MASTAREAEIQAIRYESVRDPDHGVCTALLTPAAFTGERLVEQTWRLSVTRQRIQWQRDSALHRESFEFDAPG